ncbi:GntR family transcriptional regulator [Bacillus sp. 28A-2]|uniref:GntR family transcriptional regulator n=1 Tax=Bacillus sp. 28A-2 TaxID=2772252 RepID=UPI00168D14CE|nr:GntR family transcriptional regulator [Bacillus sp. 28A-2]MBD3859956.1 GntR family transcriptional regulator [Bacillus sp. 28A-2]
MNSFEMERPAPYYMQFYEQLKQMIFDGQFQPGERINETQLAKQFGVSRSPVREAMRLLEKDELLIADHKSGYSVYTLTERDVEELYQIRVSLETLAVELACKEAAQREIDEIEQVLTQADEAIKQQLPSKDIVQLHEAFHQNIMLASHNHRLCKQLNHVNALIHFCRIFHFSGGTRAETIQREHAAIFAKLKERRSTEAVQAMTDHLLHDASHLKQVLSETTKDE